MPMDDVWLKGKLELLSDRERKELLAQMDRAILGRLGCDKIALEAISSEGGCDHESSLQSGSESDPVHLELAASNAA